MFVSGFRSYIVEYRIRFLFTLPLKLISLYLCGSQRSLVPILHLELRHNTGKAFGLGMCNHCLRARQTKTTMDHDGI